MITSQTQPLLVIFSSEVTSFFYNSGKSVQIIFKNIPQSIQRYSNLLILEKWEGKFQKDGRYGRVSILSLQPVIYVLASHTGETPALEAIYVQDWTKMQNLQVQIQVAKKEITPQILNTKVIAVRKSSAKRFWFEC